MGAVNNMQQQSLKQRMRDGQVIVGIVIPPRIERQRFKAILDHGPFDFVAVDSQHNPLNESGLVEVCALAGEFGIPVQFRIKHTRHTYLIGNMLDLGPTGIEVPQVELDSTVDEAIENLYYPPIGKRSFGPIAGVGAKDHPDPFEYAKWWNANGILWLQLESVEAVEKAYRLAKSGADCMSFGPTDLSFSLKYNSHPRLKTVDDCVHHVVRSLEESSVSVCMRSFAANKRQQYIDMGVTVILEHFASLTLP